MNGSIEDLPQEILVLIFKKLDLVNDLVKNCLWACKRWHEIVARFFLKAYINDLAKDNQDMRNTLVESGWKFDPHHGDNGTELILSLYERFKCFKVIVATGDPYENGQRTEIIDLLNPNRPTEFLPNSPPGYGAAGELLKASNFSSSTLVDSIAILIL